MLYVRHSFRLKKFFNGKLCAIDIINWDKELKYK